MSKWPGACEIANGGRDAITAACGVTPQAQKTGSVTSSTGHGLGFRWENSRRSSSRLRRRAPAAAARGGDLHDVASGEGDVGLGRQRPAVEPVAPAPAGLAAVAARGGVAATVGEQR